MTEFAEVGLPTRVKAEPLDPGNPPKLPDDGYPKIIFDQREMFRRDTVEEVKAYWVEFLAAKGLEPLRDDRVLTPRIGGVLGQARACWKALCPECNGGIALWDQNPQGCCLSCGRVYKVAWQLPALRSEVIRILAARPIGNQVWDAHLGETVERLKVQNQIMLGVGTAERNGLLVGDNVKIPDEFASAHDYLEHLRTVERKAAL